MTPHRPTLVCLHGVGGSAGEWGPAARALGDRATIVPAVPGDGRFVLVGHSFGGVEAIALASQRPERVDGLVLTGSFFPPARGGRSYAATAWDYARHRAKYLRELADRRRTPRPTPSKAGQLSKLARLAMRPLSFHAVADGVRCPVLVIHGADDHVVPVAFARAAAAVHPEWTYAEVPGGHAVHHDRPHEWAAVVAPWLVVESSA